MTDWRGWLAAIGYWGAIVGAFLGLRAAVQLDPAEMKARIREDQEARETSDRALEAKERGWREFLEREAPFAPELASLLEFERRVEEACRTEIEASDRWSERLNDIHLSEEEHMAALDAVVASTTAEMDCRGKAMERELDRAAPPTPKAAVRTDAEIDVELRRRLGPPPSFPRKSRPAQRRPPRRPLVR